jgi:hypothetical protein
MEAKWLKEHPGAGKPPNKELAAHQMPSAPRRWCSYAVACSRGDYTTRRTAEGSAISIAAIVGLTAIVGPASMWCQPWW